MNDFGDNPYSPPTTPTKPLGKPLSEWDFYNLPLATRWQRLAGSIIDGVILLILILPVGMIVGVLVFAIYPEYIDNDTPSLTIQIIENVILMIMVIGIFLAVNGYLLVNRGQTVGKFLMKTMIVSDDDELVPLSRLFLMRYLVVWLIGMIPFIGNLFNIANALAIFRSNRKCIHDEICGTKVVMVHPPK